jgi:hypothetical protein
MMSAAKWDRELVADLATQRTVLREPEMMWIRGVPPADQTGALGDELEMLFVTVATGLTEREGALVDAAIRASSRGLAFASGLYGRRLTPTNRRRLGLRSPASVIAQCHHFGLEGGFNETCVYGYQGIFRRKASAGPCDGLVG